MVVNNSTDIVNLFAKYSSDTYSISQHPLNLCSQNTNNINSNSTLNLNSISFTELEVLSNIISNLILSSNIGPDGIPIIFLYNCRFTLTIIFKLSLNKGLFSLI